MTTVYILSFEAQWLDDAKIVRGMQAYPVTAPSGLLDLTTAIAACEIVAAQGGSILFPEMGVDVRTVAMNLPDPPIWDDADVRIY